MESFLWPPLWGRLSAFLPVVALASSAAKDWEAGGPLFAPGKALPGETNPRKPGALNRRSGLSRVGER